MTRFFTVLFMLLLFTFSPFARAGYDLQGPVQRVTIAADGRILFAMDTTAAAQYCAPGWANLTLYIPREHPEYPYYFAMLLAAASKGRSIIIANISSVNGTNGCDVTKTGYGIVFL